METMIQEMFDAISEVLPGITKREKTICNCPFCGDEKKHFAYARAGWYKCVRCNAHGSLRALAELLRVGVGDYIAPIRNERPAPEIARWRLNPHELMRRYQTHAERFTRWAAYKPLHPDTINRYKFGFGPLPFQRDNGEWYMSKSNWLIVPVYQDGALVALRGRNIGTVGPKWISATGSNYALWGAQDIPSGAIVWIVENYVDAAWLMQAHPEYYAVAIGGASAWNSDWTNQIAAAQPLRVIVALDNDLVGNGGGALRDELIAEWKATHEELDIPKANGPAIANKLLERGIPTNLFEWPDDAPAKAGMDWILKQETAT